MIRNEYFANEALASRARPVSALDKVGRNALEYKPSLRNIRTVRPSLFTRIIAAVLGAL